MADAADSSATPDSGYASASASASASSSHVNAAAEPGQSTALNEATTSNEATASNEATTSVTAAAAAEEKEGSEDESEEGSEEESEEGEEGSEGESEEESTDDEEETDDDEEETDDEEEEMDEEEGDEVSQASTSQDRMPSVIRPVSATPQERQGSASPQGRPASAIAQERPTSATALENLQKISELESQTRLDHEGAGSRPSSSSSPIEGDGEKGPKAKAKAKGTGEKGPKAKGSDKLPAVKGAKKAERPPPFDAPPPPKEPRARHPLDNVDPDFIKTAAYTNRPGVGQVYDWSAHHFQNKHIQNQKKEQKRACELIDAARKELENRSNSERAFQQWLNCKEHEKIRLAQRRRELMQLSSMPVIYHEPPEVLEQRERKWQDNFGARAHMVGHNTPLGLVDEGRALTHSAGAAEARRPIRLEALMWKQNG